MKQTKYLDKSDIPLIKSEKHNWKTDFTMENKLKTGYGKGAGLHFTIKTISLNKKESTYTSLVVNLWKRWRRKNKLKFVSEYYQIYHCDPSPTVSEVKTKRGTWINYDLSNPSGITSASNQKARKNLESTIGTPWGWNYRKVKKHY